jgi:hypothetical protein
MDSNYFVHISSENQEQGATDGATVAISQNACGLRSSSAPTTNDNIPSPEEIPDEFICPISLQPMVHPLTTRSGRNFERSAILNWLRDGNGCCPLTRQPLRPSDLIPNRQLESRIRFWRTRNNLPEPTEEEGDFEAVTFLGFIPVTKDLTSRHLGSTPTSLHEVVRSYMRSSQSADTSWNRSTDYSFPDEMQSLSRSPREGRRNFLHRVLNQATEDLRDL